MDSSNKRQIFIRDFHSAFLKEIHSLYDENEITEKNTF